ncbi:glycosyltransferase family 4 protein [Metabacillus sp. FJAT-52054]|uniref:Glycosyltransferase family 4 protein n=1 Tax=Metabacillus sediminis TaxID=3117746 RepID=A0ABZ2NKN1_9BACI
MKILFTFYLPSGGMETLNRIRAKSLANMGIESHLLYLFNAEGKKNIIGIPAYITNDDAKIKEILDQHQFDAIVVCTDFYLMERIRNLGYSGKIIYEVQGLGIPSEAAAVVDQAAPYIKSYAQAILYPQTSHLIHLFNSKIPEFPQYCFNNPLDVYGFGYRTHEKISQPIIGWVGRLEPNKNWSFFLELCSHLIKWNNNLTIWMFGDLKLSADDQKEEFKKRTEQLNLTSHLIHHEDVPNHEMADYYSKIGDSGGFLSSTSILEGFGYSVSEALLCRCPVVATDSDGIRNFIIHNYTGKINHQGDLMEAVNHAKEIIINTEDREKIREQGVLHIKQNFPPEKYGNSFNVMLRSLGIIGP